MLVLSLFPGIGLLDRAFEEAGFCLVRGPDRLWGGDIRRFHSPAGVFWGVLGGPPCQEFSGLLRTEPSGYGLAMLKEYARVVTEAQPEWSPIMSSRPNGWQCWPRCVIFGRLASGRWSAPNFRARR